MGEHVEAALGAVPDALVGVGREGMVPSVNRRTEQLFGHEPDDLVEPLVAESARPAQKVHVRCCLTLSSIYEESGAVIGAAATPRDMAAVQHGFDSARSMIKSSLDSLVAISAQGKITDVNEATVAGVPRDKLIGTTFSKYFTDPEKADRIYKLVSSQAVALDYALTMGHRGGDPHRGLTTPRSTVTQRERWSMSSRPPATCPNRCTPTGKWPSSRPGNTPGSRSSSGPRR